MSILRFANPRTLAIVFGLAALAVAPAQETEPQGLGQPAGVPQGPGPQGAAREAMWFAPTAEDWKKPVLIEFQRSWEDAVAVSRETGKPILVCVNMDGEIASEHYAGVRYRQPEIAKLYQPYVCVIASTYRHNERDYDEHGNRIECPRFGSVTCGEHIHIEPILYEKFLDGRRIAPRHIMVELDGTETYDVYYAFDTDSVFQAIQDGVASREIEPRTIVRGDRSIVERVASRDIKDRLAVEDAYRAGDEKLRTRLLEAARDSVDKAPIELLRLAVNGFDPELAAIAHDALAQVDAVQATDVIEDALRAPMEQADRKKLIASLERLGEKSARAQTLAVVHQGLATQSRAVDVGAWSSGGASYAARPARATIESMLDSRVADATSRPADVAAMLALAEAALALALNPETRENLAADVRTGAMYQKLMIEDARRAALEAERLGAGSAADTAWRLNAVLALCAWHGGDKAEAYARAKAAAPHIPAADLAQLDQLGGQLAWNAASTLAVFAEARHLDIVEAARRKEQWPGEWLTDVSSAYSVLAKHPVGTDVQVASHFDLLWFLGARSRASRVLDEGLARFPSSATLHDCLRSRVLREHGVGGLATTYDEMLTAEDAAPDLPWFAGYASLIAAEFHRRRGRAEQAVASYDRALGLLDRAIAQVPESETTADHFAALCLGGQARVALESGDLERALQKIVQSFDRCPTAAASLDGLNLSPVDTAKMLRAKLTELDRSAELATLEAALAELDPRMLQLPGYEFDPQGGRPSPDVPQSGRGRRRR